MLIHVSFQIQTEAILSKDAARDKALFLHANPCISLPCFPRPPVTRTGACEAVREKAEGKLKKQGCTVLKIYNPALPMLMMEAILVSFSVRGGKNEA